MCGHADNVIESLLLWQERHFPWGFNLWYIVLEIVPATFTQLEMLQLSPSKILESSPVSRASDSGWYSGKLKSQWAEHWPVSHTPVTCHQAGTDPQLGRVTRGRIWKSRATMQSSFPQLVSLLACSLQSQGHQPEWGLTFIAEPVLFCVFNVLKSMSRLMEWGRKSWRED